MKNKDRIYETDISTLPSLKVSHGDGSKPEKNEKHRIFRPFGDEKSDADTRNVVKKLIGHLINNDD